MATKEASVNELVIVGAGQKSPARAAEDMIAVKGIFNKGHHKLHELVITTKEEFFKELNRVINGSSLYNLTCYFSAYGSCDSGGVYILPTVANKDKTYVKDIVQHLSKTRIGYCQILLQLSLPPEVDSRPFRSVTLPSHKNFLVAISGLNKEEVNYSGRIGGTWTKFLCEKSAKHPSLPMTSILNMVYHETYDVFIKMGSVAQYTSGGTVAPPLETPRDNDYKKPAGDKSTASGGGGVICQPKPSLSSGAIESKLNEKIDKREVCEKFKEIAPKWREFGKKLGISNLRLDVLGANGSDVVKLQRIINEVIKMNPDITYAKLMGKVRLVDGKLCDKIMKM
jgi:hypothetical protein